MSRLPMANPTRSLCLLSGVRHIALPYVHRYLAAASEVLSLWSSRPRSRRGQLVIGSYSDVIVTVTWPSPLAYTSLSIYADASRSILWEFQPSDGA